jgi:IS4 transposase
LYRLIYKKVHDTLLVFLTNHLEIPAITVANIYRMRWQIELFFRWIKGHLRIKHYFGTSPNAVKTQIWIAVSVYLMVAIIHKQLKLPGTLHRTLQLLSVHPFEKVLIHELLTESEFKPLEPQNRNQLMLFDL